MPLSLSNRTLRLLEEIRLRDEDIPGSEYPVFVDSRLVRGFFPALALGRLIKERDDLSYIGKLTRNADAGAIPGFTFIREGAETLSVYIRGIEAQQKAAAGSPSP